MSSRSALLSLILVTYLLWKSCLEKPFDNFYTGEPWQCSDIWVRRTRYCPSCGTKKWKKGKGFQLICFKPSHFQYETELPSNDDTVIIRFVRWAQWQVQQAPACNMFSQWEWRCLFDLSRAKSVKLFPAILRSLITLCFYNSNDGSSI